MLPHHRPYHARTSLECLASSFWPLLQAKSVGSRSRSHVARCAVGIAGAICFAFRFSLVSWTRADVCRFSTTADIAATSSVRSAPTLSADCLPSKRISHWAGTWWRIGVYARPCAVWLRRFGLPDPQRVCLKCSNKLMRFDEIMNWRDLGSCHASLQRGLLFRSASLSGASEVSSFCNSRR